MEHKRTNYSSGAPLEEKVGYSRMVKIDDQVFIGGTTSVQPDGSVYGETAYEQARYIFDKMLVLLAKVGAGARDVYRVDYFVTDMAYGADVGRAYSETFHDGCVRAWPSRA